MAELTVDEEEPNETWKLILRSYLGWLEVIGAILSLVFLAIREYEIGCILGVIVISVMVGTVIHYLKKTKKLLREIARLKQEIEGLKKDVEIYKDCPQYLHDAIHRVRDELQSETVEKCAKGDVNFNDRAPQLIRDVLLKLEVCFLNVTKTQCCASIMFPNDFEKPETLQTVLRTGTEPQARRTSEPTRLLINQGMAGLAFKTGQSQFSNNYYAQESGNLFFDVRGNSNEFYKSGISAPFRVNGAVYGVLNIDCMETDVFHKKHKFAVKCIADLIGLIYQIWLYLGASRSSKMTHNTTTKG